MRRSQLSFVLVSFILAASSPSTTRAQWAASAQVGAARFWGGSAERGSENRSFRPYRPTIFGVGVERADAKVGWGLRLYYAGSSLALEGPDALAVVKGALKVYGAAPEVSVRVAPIGNGGQLRAYAGPAAEIWSLGDGVSHLRLGAEAALGLMVPLGGRLSGAIRVGATVIPTSPFGREDLDPAFDPRALWRREVGASLQYRL